MPTALPVREPLSGCCRIATLEPCERNALVARENGLRVVEPRAGLTQWHTAPAFLKSGGATVVALLIFELHFESLGVWRFLDFVLNPRPPVYNCTSTPAACRGLLPRMANFVPPFIDILRHSSNAGKTLAIRADLVSP